MATKALYSYVRNFPDFVISSFFLCVFGLQLEFGVDMEDCVSAVGETVRLARNNPHTNMFTEVDNNNNNIILGTPSFSGILVSVLFCSGQICEER